MNGIMDHGITIFVLLAAAVAAAVSLGKWLFPSVVIGKERWAAIVVSIVVAVVAIWLGWIPGVELDPAAIVATAVGLVASSGAAYEHLFRLFSSRPTESELIAGVETDAIVALNRSREASETAHDAKAIALSAAGTASAKTQG